jgi:hypothetical protein
MLHPLALTHLGNCRPRRHFGIDDLDFEAKDSYEVTVTVSVTGQLITKGALDHGTMMVSSPPKW